MADAPRKLAAALVAQVSPPLFAVQVAVRRVVDAFNDVPVAFLAFVVELNGKVGQVRDERAAERAGGSEGDELLVL